MKTESFQFKCNIAKRLIIVIAKRLCHYPIISPHSITHNFIQETRVWCVCSELAKGMCSIARLMIFFLLTEYKFVLYLKVFMFDIFGTSKIS